MVAELPQRPGPAGMRDVASVIRRLDELQHRSAVRDRGGYFTVVIVNIGAVVPGAGSHLAGRGRRVDHRREVRGRGFRALSRKAGAL